MAQKGELELPSKRRFTTAWPRPDDEAKRMADDTDDDKTEEPTEKRLADAVERGNTPVSREVTFLAALVRLSHRSRSTPAARGDAGLVAALAHFLDDPSGWRLEQAAT